MNVHQIGITHPVVLSADGRQYVLDDDGLLIYGGWILVWTPAKDRLLGTMSDVDLARRLSCSPMAAFYLHRKLGIPRYRSPPLP